MQMTVSKSLENGRQARVLSTRNVGYGKISKKDNFPSHHVHFGEVHTYLFAFIAFEEMALSHLIGKRFSVCRKEKRPGNGDAPHSTMDALPSLRVPACRS